MTTDGERTMIIGTIVTRYLADGTVIPGDGCDTAPVNGATMVGDMNNATTAEPTPTTITAETLAERIARLAPGEDCTGRMDILADAADAGVTDKDLALLAKAPRIAEGDEITLPRHKLENLSRGKGWARCGSGRSAEWGKRCADGYRVGPGYWVVGGSDGFNRKGEITWDVSHVRAGGKVWTVAV